MRPLRTIWFAAVVAVAAAVPGLAASEGGADATPPLLTLEQALQQALDDNPSIAASAQRWRAAQEATGAAGALPNPTVMVGQALDPVQTRLGPLDRRIDLTFPYPWPAKRSTQKSMAQVEADKAALRHQQTVRRVLTQVKAAYFELVYLDQALAATEKHHAALERLLALADKAYAQNAATAFDQGKAASETARAAFEQSVLQDLRGAQAARLNTLLHRPAATALATVPLQPKTQALPSVETMEERLRSHRQEVLLAGLEEEQAHLQKRAAALSGMPDFSVGFSYSEVGSGSPMPGAGRDATMVMLGTTLPLWRSTYRAATDAARHRTQAAVAARDEELDQAVAQLHQKTVQATNAQRLIRLYEDTLLPQATDNLRRVQTLFDEGQAPYQDVLQSATVVWQFRMALWRAHTDYGKTLADLEDLTGGGLSGDAEGTAVTLLTSVKHFFHTTSSPSSGEPSVSAESTLGTQDRPSLPDEGQTARTAGVPVALLRDVLAMAPEARQHWLATSASLALTVAVALADHPRLKALAGDVSAAGERYGQTTYLEDLAAAYVRLSSPGMTRPLSMKDQPVSMSSLASQVVDAQVAQARLAYLAAVRDITLDASVHWEKLVQARRTADLLSGHVALVAKMTQVAATLYENGKLDYAQVTRWQLHEREMRRMLSAAREEAATHEAALAAELHLPGLHVGALPVDVPTGGLPDNRTLEALLEQHHPGLGMAREKARAMALMERMASLSAVSDATSGLSRPTAGEGFGQVDRGLADPTAGTGLAYVRELSARRGAMENTVAETRRSALTHLAETAGAFRQAAEDVDHYTQHLIPKAREAFEAARLSYGSSQGGYIPLVEMHHEWVQKELAALAVRRQLRIARHQTAAAVGTFSLTTPGGTP